MNDYIKRSDALDRFTYEHGELIPEVLENGSENTVGVKDVKSVLRSIPAADVAPVVHAEWVKRSFVSSDVFCSECHTLETTKDSNYKSRYCPHCGAKMDG